MKASYRMPLRAAILLASFLVSGLFAFAQSAGNSTSVAGTVLDPSGAVVPNATVEIHNPVSGFARTATTNDTGGFVIPNVPFNPYHLMVTSHGFAPHVQDIDVRSVVPLNLSINLKVQSSEVVNVESGGDPPPSTPHAVLQRAAQRVVRSSAERACDSSQG